MTRLRAFCVYTDCGELWPPRVPDLARLANLRFVVASRPNAAIARLTDRPNVRSIDLDTCEQENLSDVATYLDVAIASLRADLELVSDGVVWEDMCAQPGAASSLFPRRSI